MPENITCAACGAELAADAVPDGLCPACLPKAGSAVDSHEAAIDQYRTIGMPNHLEMAEGTLASI